MDFAKFLTPKQAAERYKHELAVDEPQTEFVWVFATPRSKLHTVGSAENVEIMMTTRAMVEARPNLFADMKVVPAYPKDE